MSSQVTSPKDNIKIGQEAILLSLQQIQMDVRRYNVVKPVVRKLQEQLFSHFGHQNKEFFNQLREFFKEDQGKEKYIEFLEFNLKEIKVTTLLFYDQFPGGMADIHPVNFPKHFMDFSQELSMRIGFEKEYLFPLLDKLLKD